MAKPIRVAAIIKVTENCNYNCDFCFYAKKHYDWKKTMTIDMCKDIIRKTSDYNYANGVKKSNIIFHGGEPLIRGIDFFQEMMDFEQEIMTEYPDRTFDNTIQTNASLVDSNWIAFFKKYNFNVGISLDGDGELNYHYATENDEQNIEHIISVYHSMDDAGINVGILSVITEKHSKDTKRFYDFIVNNGIKKIAILPCINDISNYTIKVQALSNFMMELFDFYFYGTYRVTIREFTNVIERALGYTQVRSCANCGRMSCGTFLTYDSQGNIFFCDKAYDKERIIANISQVNIEDIFDNPKYCKERSQCMNFYNTTCLNCPIKNLCNGSCYRNDVITASGEITNRFCDVYKIVYPYIEEAVKRLKENS